MLNLPYLSSIDNYVSFAYNTREKLLDEALSVISTRTIRLQPTASATQGGITEDLFDLAISHGVGLIVDLAAL